MSEKPLHVKVAEALGCPARGCVGGRSDFPKWVCGCEYGAHGSDVLIDGCWSVKRYDTDWSAAGPLIDRFGIGLQRYGLGATEASRKAWPNGHWSAIGFPVLGGELSAPGQTAILAVCDLIVTAFAELGGLKEAGEPETTQASPR